MAKKWWQKDDEHKLNHADRKGTHAMDAKNAKKQPETEATIYCDDADLRKRGAGFAGVSVDKWMLDWQCFRPA